MKTRLSLVFLAIVVFVAPAAWGQETRNAEDPETLTEHGMSTEANEGSPQADTGGVNADQAGERVREGAEEAGRGGEQGAKEAGQGVREGAEEAGEAVRDTGKSAERESQRVVDSLGRLFDKAKVTTVAGSVARVETVQIEPAPPAYVQIQLRTDTETLPVILAPEQYLRERNMQLAMGDTVEVTGSRVKLQNQMTLIGSVLRRNGDTVPLRDNMGRPLWSRQ